VLSKFKVDEIRGSAREVLVNVAREPLFPRFNLRALIYRQSIIKVLENLFVIRLLSAEVKDCTFQSPGRIAAKEAIILMLNLKKGSESV